MSIHKWKAMDKAARMGGYAGCKEAEPLWDMSKRELVEIAMRLTMASSPADAVKQVFDEHQALKANGII